jgi:NAD(P)-dependent dehydrogenase (short-subunit alcohol dehydrogenase family)
MARMVDGKVVVVTGSGGGIGKGIALLMAAHGAKVVVNDIGAALDGSGHDDGPAAATVREIKAAGGEAVANTDSVADPKGAERLIQTGLDAFGRIDAVVNNAGILRDRIFHRMSLDEWRAVIDVHLNGSFHVSKAAANHFKEQGSGAFVHFTSTSGLVGNLGQANYSAAKMGIVGISKSIALDMAKFGVRSNAIAPFAWSRMIGSIPVTDEAQKARVAKLQSMTPDKIAPLVVYLCADSAKEVTGQIFSVRNNEIFLMSQPRPIRSVQASGGWTPEAIAAHAMPALKASFYDLDVSADVFSWDPV